MDHALCKIYLTPAAYKRKSDEEEREKKRVKKDEEEKVDPVTSHQKIPEELKFF